MTPCSCGCGAVEPGHCWRESADEPCCICGAVPCTILLYGEWAVCGAEHARAVIARNQDPRSRQLLLFIVCFTAGASIPLTVVHKWWTGLVLACAVAGVGVFLRLSRSRGKT